MKQILLIISAVTSLLFVGCSKDTADEVDEGNVDTVVTTVPISLEDSTITLYRGDIYQIEATSETSITYEVTDEYYADVTRTGIVSARFVGRTKVILSNGSDTKTVDVTVAPKIKDLYPMPNIGFKDTRDSVIAKFGIPDYESDEVDKYHGFDYIQYSNYSEQAPYLNVHFESNAVKSYEVFLYSIYDLAINDKEQVDYERQLPYFIGLRDTLFNERYVHVEASSDYKIHTYRNGLTPQHATMYIKVTHPYNVYLPKSYIRVEYYPPSGIKQ